MRSGPVTWRRLAAGGLLVLALLLLSACGTETPQNTFAPAGDVAETQRNIFLMAMWPALAILIIVEGLLVYALIRFRRRGDDPGLPKQVHGNTKLEIAWTIAPALLLLGLAVPMVAAIVDLGREPAEDALQIRVTGFQWNWQFEYPQYTDAEGNPLRVIGTCPTRCAEMHIPVGREVAVILKTSDVIHSFWVPRLAGKLDAVPGRTNRMWLKANEPGVFSGQCAEFCGLGHADMRFTVVAETEEEFLAWVNEQLGVSSAPDGEPAAAREGE